MPHSLYQFSCLLLLISGIALAEEKPPSAKEVTEKREREFTEMLSHVTLSGIYTHEDPKKEPGEERYTVYRVAKVPGRQHLWRFDVRMQFGSVNLRMPLPLTVRWAQDTPLVILDDYSIPGLGSFSAKVLFDKTRYAGTWQHGSDGGHLYGKIVKEVPKEH